MTIKTKKDKASGVGGFVLWSLVLFFILKNFGELYSKYSYGAVLLILILSGTVLYCLSNIFQWEILQFNEDNFVFIEHRWTTPSPLYYKWIESITIINNKIYIEINKSKHPLIKIVIEKDKFDSFTWETVVSKFSELKENIKNNVS